MQISLVAHKVPTFLRPLTRKTWVSGLAANFDTLLAARATCQGAPKRAKYDVIKVA